MITIALVLVCEQTDATRVANIRACMLHLKPHNEHIQCLEAIGIDSKRRKEWREQNALPGKLGYHSLENILRIILDQDSGNSGHFWSCPMASDEWMKVRSIVMHDARGGNG